MRNWNLFLAVAIFTLSTFSPLHGQDKKIRECFYTRERALADIKNNTAKILVQGGIASVLYPADKAFLEKYKISYYIFGCVAPESGDCLNEYNKAVFDHLDKAFGKGWRNEVRKDAIALR